MARRLAQLWRALTYRGPLRFTRGPIENLLTVAAQTARLIHPPKGTHT